MLLYESERSADMLQSLVPVHELLAVVGVAGLVSKLVVIMIN